MIPCTRPLQKTQGAGHPILTEVGALPGTDSLSYKRRATRPLADGIQSVGVTCRRGIIGENPAFGVVSPVPTLPIIFQIARPVVAEVARSVSTVGRREPVVDVEEIGGRETGTTTRSQRLRPAVAVFVVGIVVTLGIGSVRAIGAAPTALQPTETVVSKRTPIPVDRVIGGSDLSVKIAERKRIRRAGPP